MHAIPTESIPLLPRAPAVISLVFYFLICLLLVGAVFSFSSFDPHQKRAEACAKSAAELNRLVTVTTEKLPLEQLPDDYFLAFRCDLSAAKSCIP